MKEHQDNHEKPKCIGAKTAKKWEGTAAKIVFH